MSQDFSTVDGYLNLHNFVEQHLARTGRRYFVVEVNGRNDLNQLPVMSNGKLAGMISRAHVLQLLQTRAELHV
jgi:hypothetical protein